MPSGDKISLAKARAEGKMDQFMQEHEADTSGDEEAFNRALQSMAGKSKATPAASKPERSGD